MLTGDADRVAAERASNALLTLVSEIVEAKRADLADDLISSLILAADGTDRLRANPSLLPNAVEEFLRYDSPTYVSHWRRTTEEIRIGDVTVSADEFLFIALISVNRDPARFERPDAQRAAGAARPNRCLTPQPVVRRRGPHARAATVRWC